MLKEREQKTADYFGITDKVENFKSDLLKIPGVVDVEFDLDEFYDNLHQLIFLPKYDIDVAATDYFNRLRQLLHSVLEVAKNHGLSRTGDDIENYGEHFYIVCRCDWEISEQQEVNSGD